MREEDMKYLQRSHAWITAYAPYEDPEFVVSIIVEHGGHGGSAAGPKASKIFDKLFEMGYIDVKFKKSQTQTKNAEAQNQGDSAF